MKRIRISKRFMAYLLLIGGTVATVAANIAHAHDNFGAKALSAVIPALLFVAFHVAAADGRWLVRSGTGVVALLCFAISYDHISALAVRYGEGDVSAVLYPLAIDGAMIVATFVLSRTEDQPAAVLSGDQPALSAVPKPVRPAVREDKPVLSAKGTEDKPRTNGFVRPLPPRTEPKDNDARLSAARKIADELGDSLNRAELVKRLKAMDFKISSQAAADLTRELKAARS